MVALVMYKAFTYMTLLWPASAMVPPKQHCPTGNACICKDSIMDCRNNNFTNITNFYYDNVDAYDTLDYSENSVSSLPPSSFAELSLKTLILESNNISSVAEMAFHGIEKQLLRLNLANNNLTNLPVAISRLRVLKELDVSGNPLDGIECYEGTSTVIREDGLTSSVMGNISNTLETFSFGHLTALKHWPETLTKLQRLVFLAVRGSNIGLLFAGSFHGFESTLRSLTLEYGHFRQIPLSIGELRRLEELHIDHNINSNGDTIVNKQPFQDISSTLRVLSLNYDNLTHFPSVFKYLRNLRNLSLEGNNFTYISDESIHDLKITNVSVLNLKKCLLRRVPGSLTELSKLVELDLSYNLIRTIEYRDIERLQALVFLSLKGNPLRYISKSAFYSLPSLRHLDLSETLLTSLSEGLQNLSVDTLDLTDSSVECTCDIFWMKNWVDLLKDFGTEITIKGRCENIDEFISRYVDYRIPSCPDFV